MTTGWPTPRRQRRYGVAAALLALLLVHPMLATGSEHAPAHPTPAHTPVAASEPANNTEAAPPEGGDGMTVPSVNDAMRERALAPISYGMLPTAAGAEEKRREIYKGTILEDLPASLEAEKAKDALLDRQSIPIYTHNPAEGPTDAPITIIEFSDLGCTSCKDDNTALAEAFKKYPGFIRWIHKHLAENPYAPSDMPAFFSMIANRYGLFWKFRTLLDKQTEPPHDTDLLNMLAQVGVDTSNSQALVRLYARDIYRELDADQLQAQNFGFMEPPQIFVNGIKVGGAIPLTALDDLIRFELNRLKVDLSSLPKPATAQGKKTAAKNNHKP